MNSNKNNNKGVLEMFRSKIISNSSERSMTSSKNWLEAKDIMTRNVIVTYPEEDLITAVKKMSENDVSCIIVEVDKIIKGILTETDLLKRAASHTHDFNQLKVSDVMTSNVHCISENLSAIEASKVMESKHIKRLPVTHKNKLAGLITQTDMVRVLVSYGMWRDVIEIMNENVATVQKDSKISEAIKIMNDRKISCVVIQDRNDSIGIFTERDLLNRVIAKQLNFDEHILEEVMSSPIISITHDYSVLSASKLMDKEKIRRLIVLENGRLRGVLSQTDILLSVKKKLQEEEDDNLNLLEESDRCIFTLDLNNNVTYLNPASLDLLEISDQKHFYGKTFGNVIKN